MKRKISKICALIVAASPLLGSNPSVAAQALNLACVREPNEPIGFFAPAETVRLTLGPKSQVYLNLGHGDAGVHVVSNNKIQLQVKGKGFTAEYFHYSGQLFIIDSSGRPIRFSCHEE